MIDSEGRWWPDLNPKGYEVFNDYHRFLLLWGPRQSTKTINACNKLIRHLWENDGAKVAIIGKSIRNIKSSGVWQDLTEVRYGIPQWLAAGIGMEFLVPPKMTADTKMTYFKIRNAHGGFSECQIHSLEHDFEVELKFKGTRYTMFYLPEADTFKDRKVFLIFADQLRSDTVTEDQFQILLDCNPPEEGEDHFLHDLFFKKIHPNGDAFAEQYAARFNQVHFNLDDNLWMSKESKDALKEQYRYDPALYSRYAMGDTWAKFSTTGHFHGFFSQERHVFGNSFGPRSDWEILVPSEKCVSFNTGWDFGDVNHAWSCYASEDHLDPTRYLLLDEVVHIDSQISLEDFTDIIMERMDFWEKTMRMLYNTPKLNWTHWSDPSAFKFRAIARGDEALAIRHYSEGKIVLRGVHKPGGSVKRRISTLRRLLFDDRWICSASCVHHIDMLKRIRQPPRGTGLIHPQDPLKHVFDSATYALAEEIPMDLERRYQPNTTKPSMLSLLESHR